MGSRFWYSILSVLSVLLVCASSHAQDAKTLLATADERIERHRKGDITLSLTDSRGIAIPDGTTVSVKLERHEFLFGANFFAFGEADGWDEAEYASVSPRR